MKFPQTFLVLLILGSVWGCRGTEVGNGRSQPTPQSNTSPDKADVSSPDDAGSESPESGSGGKPSSDMNDLSPTEHLFANCASPLAETTAGTFVDSLGGEDLVIAADPDGEWLVTIGEEETAVTSATSGANPYGISSEAAAKALSCSSVVTEANERSVVYGDEFRIVWTLDNASAVSKIEIFDDEGTLVASFEKP